ncbi:unnamed protein product [Closterium sp. NIES-64]|nr:unnamed protein product [Closterium sp. NIES-64]
MHLLADRRWSYIVSRAVDGRVMAQVDGQVVPQDLEAGNKKQHWRTIRCGDGYHLIQNRATKNVLDHWGGEKIAAENRNWTDHHHQWQIINVDGGFVAFKNRASGNVLDFWYESSYMATNDDLHHHHHNWRIIRADQVAGAEHSATSSDEEEESPGVKEKVVAQVDEQVVPANLEPGNEQQHWRTIRCGNGYHVIQNRATKNVLDHWSSQRMAADNRNWEDPHHQWQIVQTEGEFVVLKNRASGAELDFYYGNSIQSTNRDSHHHYHQWRIIRTDQVAGANPSSTSSEGEEEEEESPGVKLQKIKCDERHLL